MLGELFKRILACEGGICQSFLSDQCKMENLIKNFYKLFGNCVIQFILISKATNNTYTVYTTHNYTTI